MAPLIRHYPTNRYGRTFVSGDWHGCYNQVQDLLKAVDFDFSKDVLYQAGDMINRGGQSRRCIELLEGPRTHPDGHWLRPAAGNHELEFIRATDDPCYNWEPIIRHGGRWGYNLDPAVRQVLANHLRKLPAAIVVGEGDERFNVFHAEWHGNDASLDKLGSKRQAPVTLYGGRGLFEGDIDPCHHIGLSPSFVGHSTVENITMIGSHIYLDTGSYLGEGGRTASGISFIEPATQRVWQYTYGRVEEKT